MDEHSESERSLTTQSVVDNYLKEPTSLTMEEKSKYLTSFNKSG